MYEWRLNNNRDEKATSSKQSLQVALQVLCLVAAFVVSNHGLAVRVVVGLSSFIVTGLPDRLRISKTQKMYRNSNPETLLIDDEPNTGRVLCCSYSKSFKLSLYSLLE
jgi:hypothetical protein